MVLRCASTGVRLKTLAGLGSMGCLASALSIALGCSPASEAVGPGIRAERMLPPPSPAGTVSLDDALSRRRSARSWSSEALSEDEVSRLAWSAQGLTDNAGHRTAPSAGALYPLELYLLNAEGVFRYVPEGHKLEQLELPDKRGEVAKATFGQDVVGAAPMLVVVTGVIARTRAKYGDRAERFVALEVGHATQNILLQATALGLGARPVGAFEDEAVRSALQLPSGIFPYYVVCVGKPAP